MAAPWTAEQLDYMDEYWGIKTVPQIAKKIGRSTSAVREKAVREGLGRHIHSGDYITYGQLFVALGLRYAYTSVRLIRDGLPVRTKKSITKPYRIVYIEEFWEWLERNKTLISLHNLEPNMLGKEPEWVQKKRDADIAAQKYRRRRNWTPGEDQLLITLLATYRYNCRDLSLRLVRGERAIKRRIYDLNLKTWPLAESKYNPWTDEEIAILTEMYYIGHISEVIAEKIPRSAQSIHSKIEVMIRAGQLDKNRYREEL